MTLCYRCNRTDTVNGACDAHTTPGYCTHPAYVACLEKAIQIGRPTGYIGDLLAHDMREISALPHRQVFVWMVRESGTGVITSNKGWTREGVISMAGSYRFFVWNGETLSETSVEGAWIAIEFASKGAL